MKNKKAYLVNIERSLLYELSAAKRKELEKKHPNWFDYDLENNAPEIWEVNLFFEINGTIRGSAFSKNLFAGFVS